MSAENQYKDLIDSYLRGKKDVNQFIDAYMNQWRFDRDNKTVFDARFHRLIDRIFTSCDSYSDSPEGEIEISENQLKDELRLLRYIWFG